MTLLMDIGNTRVKWATFRDGQLDTQTAALHRGWGKAEWLHLLGSVRGEVKRIVAATVAGKASAKLLAEAAAELGADLHFVDSEATAGDVVNAYPEPGQLGVDRWLAVVAAYHITRDLCCVVDVGTAATVDAVARDGRHLGGFIVPGPELMGMSLMTATSDLSERFRKDVQSGGVQLADNTRDAIEDGCTLAVAALVDRVVRDLEVAERVAPRLLITGGGAAGVLPLLRSSAETVPDLVLRGIAVVHGRNDNHSE
jgi:type III pantothenate kinase